MTITPIPNSQTELLKKGMGCNVALFFSRMAPWTWNERENKLESKYEKGTVHKGRPVTDSSIVQLGQEINHRLPSVKPVLESIHTRQTAILKTAVDHGVMVWEFRARLLSPYVSGLGSGHPTETGMILDRNSGLPYIPASAIKGMLRLACALHIAESEPAVVVPNRKDHHHLEVPDDHATLRRYFGDTDTGKADSVRGQLVFLDAFPAGTPTIETDIMNPHFGKYYAGGQGPLETENPIPVKFLTVATETEFIFRCFASPLPEQGQTSQRSEMFRPFDATDDKTVIAMFNRAFSQLGFGGKTAIGYGRFTLTATNTADHFQRLVEQDIERRVEEDNWRLIEEMKRREAEAEARRQAELDAMPEDERQLLLLEQGDLNENQVFELYNRLDDMDDRVKMKTAKALKTYWQKIGKWKKKECSIKQRQKVASIKQLLGEP